VVRFVVQHPGSAGPSGLFRHIPIVAIIPARYESTRLPGKPLADLGGRPMVEHVYRRAESARSVGLVLVATDDERVRRAVEAFGGAVRMTSASHRSGTDRLAEVADTLDCDLVVNVQGDEPFIDPSVIDAAVAPFSTDPALMMTTVRRRIEDPADHASPHVVKVVVDEAGFALYFSRAPIPHAGPDGAGAAFKHIGLYVYRRDFLLTLARLEPMPLERAERLEQLRALEHGFRIMTVETTHDTLGVDTQEDLERARRELVAAARRSQRS
jgi:3-deoxy-manno-octulosonate cytidylyltransferase (CMP-KDO synthetase)